jgi:aspartate aminotransferase-like enzyme
MINHRGAEFAALLDRIVSGMRPYLGTADADVIVLTCAGTGGLEAAVVNTLSPGDRVLAVTIGAFGDRFAKIAEVYGANVQRLSTEWGEAMDPDGLRTALELLRGRDRADPRAVLLTHNETSTGVENPVGSLVATIHEVAPDALVLVDSISAAGAVPFEMDDWGVDLVVTGSQKAWMAAPGSAMVAVGPRGWAATATARMPRFYLDLARHRDDAANGQTPWTPAVAVMYQVEEGLRLMNAQGRDAVFARHRACAAATRAGLRTLGFALLAADEVASRTVTAARIPDGLDWKAFNGGLRQRGLVVAGGQGRLTGKIFRIGHLGSVTVEEVLGAMATLEEVSFEHGRSVEAGAAVEAAQRAALGAARTTRTPAPVGAGG